MGVGNSGISYPPCARIFDWTRQLLGASWGETAGQQARVGDKCYLPLLNSWEQLVRVSRASGLCCPLKPQVTSFDGVFEWEIRNAESTLKIVHKGCISMESRRGDKSVSLQKDSRQIKACFEDGAYAIVLKTAAVETLSNIMYSEWTSL